ncbi:MAG: zinc ribbon domain-containing protein [Candidatus Thorarchaeota archaeon]
MEPQSETRRRINGEIHLENRDLVIITIGFIILGLGVALLNRGDGTFFFVFPFFFVGDLAPILAVISLFVMMMCFWWVNKRWIEDARFAQPQGRPTYLRVSSICQFCGNPIPENAAFCSACGNPVERTFGEDQQF